MSQRKFIMKLSLRGLACPVRQPSRGGPLQQGGFKDPQDVILHALHASEPSGPTSADLLAALRSSPPWLKASWASARESGPEAMAMEEIDTEIAIARLAKRQHGP